jgi:hypothetical protein
MLAKPARLRLAEQMKHLVGSTHSAIHKHAEGSPSSPGTHGALGYRMTCPSRADAASGKYRLPQRGCRLVELYQT